MGLNTTMMDSVATLVRPVIGRDARGGTTQESFEEVVCRFPCSVQQSSSRVERYYAQRNINVSTSIWVPNDVGAQVNDRIDVTDRYGVTHHFMVQGTQKGVFNRLWSPYRIDCEEIL